MPEMQEPESVVSVLASRLWKEILTVVAVRPGGARSVGVTAVADGGVDGICHDAQVSFEAL